MLKYTADYSDYAIKRTKKTIYLVAIISSTKILELG